MEQAVDAIVALHYDAENTEFTGDEMKCLGSLESALQSGLKPQRKVSQDTVLVLHLCPSHWVGHGAHGATSGLLLPSVPQCGAQDLKYYVWLMLAPLTEESQPSFSVELEGQVSFLVWKCS